MIEITNPKFIETAECILDETHPKYFIRWEYKVSKSFLRNPTGRVYAIELDENIVKFGASHAKAGIRGTLNAYTNSCVGGNPSDRTTGIAMLMYKSLKLGRKIVAYTNLLEPVDGPLEGMFSSSIIPISDAKQSENKCLEDYKSTHDGKLPIWNIQERGLTSPQIKEFTKMIIDKKFNNKQEMTAWIDSCHEIELIPRKKPKNKKYEHTMYNV